jgi:hypothetical protein
MNDHWHIIMIAGLCKMSFRTVYIPRGLGDGRLQQLTHANLYSHPVVGQPQPIAVATRSVVLYC